MCVWVKWGRESETAEMHTQGRRGTSSVQSLYLSASFSTFARLVQGHLKAPNRFSFSSFLYFREFRSSLTFSIFQLRVVWSMAKFQSDETNSNCFLRSSFSLVSPHLCWSYNIRDAHANSRNNIPHIHVACSHAFFLACHPRNLRGNCTGGQSASCLLLETGLLLVLPPTNLCDISAGE